MNAFCRMAAAATTLLGWLVLIADAAPPRLDWTVSTELLKPSDTLRVRIEVSHSDPILADVSGAGFRLDYPQHRIRLVEVRPSDVFGPDTLMFFRSEPALGRVNMAVVRKGTTGVNGTRLLASLVFVAMPVSEIQDGSVKLRDIELLLTDGTLVEPDGSEIEFEIAPAIVWPGDTNRDGRVTEADALGIGSHFGLTGPPRFDRSMEFRPTAAPWWSVPLAVHADVDGNGSVGQSDLVGLHGAFMPPDPLSTPLAVVHIPPAAAGDRFRLDVALDRPLMGMSASFGLPASVAAVPDMNTWTIPIGDGLVTFIRPDAASGMVSLAVSRPRGTPPVDAASARLSITLTLSQTILAPLPVSLYRFSATDAAGFLPAVPVRLDVVVITGTDPSPDMPTELRLLPPSPNPFNPATVIRYHLPADGWISVSVYDMLGRQVAVLADGASTAGFHAIPFDASGHGSGVYLVLLQSGSESRIQRMTLIK